MADRTRANGGNILTNAALMLALHAASLPAALAASRHGNDNPEVRSAAQERGLLFAFANGEVIGQSDFALNQITMTSGPSPSQNLLSELEPLVVTGELKNLSLKFWMYIPAADAQEIRQKLSDNLAATNLVIQPVVTGPNTIVSFRADTKSMVSMGAGLVSFSELEAEKPGTCSCEFRQKLSEIFAQTFSSATRQAAVFGPLQRGENKDK